MVSKCLKVGREINNLSPHTHIVFTRGEANFCFIEYILYLGERESIFFKVFVSIYIELGKLSYSPPSHQTVLHSL